MVSSSKIINCYSNLPFTKLTNKTISSWNSSVVECIKTYNFIEVLKLYIILKQQNLGIHGSAITFTLKSCTELRNFAFGKSVHLDTIKCGLSTNQNVGSSLIKFYSKQDDIENSAKVFDEMPERDVVAYTSMISCFSQGGGQYAKWGFDIVREMQWENVEPNRVTLVSLLHAASCLRAVGEGKSIHGYALRKGIGFCDEVFETSLLDMYVKCGFPDKAEMVFRRIRRRTIGSWNALIAGYFQSGQPFEALELFVQMVQENNKPDLITLANALLCCGDQGYLREGKNIHSYILRNGIQLDLVAATSLVGMYSKCKRMVQAEFVFDRMERQDIVSFNMMIAGYLENGLAYRAINVFSEMVLMGFRPSISIIVNVLCASSDIKDARQGMCMHGFLLRYGFESNTEVNNQLIDMYSKCGCIQFARQIFDGIGKKDIVSWTSIIKGHVNKGLADEAVILFRLMQKEKVKSDSVSLLGLLQAISELGCLSFAREVHCHVHRSLLDEDRDIFNSVINTYSRCGKLNLARNLFELMAKRDVASWNTIISAYGKHGDSVEALELFGRMKKENVASDEQTFTIVLSACSHCGLLEKGLYIFRSMKEEHGLDPSDEHYGCVVDLLSRAGRLEEAYDLLKSLPLQENASALGALLAACRVHGNTELGEVIGSRLLNLDPQNPSTYGLLSNFFAGQEKWDEVAKICTLAKEKGLKRISGYSLIEYR